MTTKLRDDALKRLQRSIQVTSGASTGCQSLGDSPVRTEDPLAATARAYPERVAAVDDSAEDGVESLTFAELNTAANRMANALLASGLRPGERIGWCSRNCLDVLVLQQACRKVGLRQAGLNPTSTPRELRDVVEVARMSMMWLSADVARRLEDDPDIGIEQIGVFESESVGRWQSRIAFINDAPGTEPDVESAPDSIGSMIYLTSGTTGRPKVVVPPAQPVQGADWALYEEIWGSQPHVYLTSGSLANAAPGGFANIAITRGYPVILQRRFDPEDWLRLVDKYKVTMSYCAPTIIRRVCDLPADCVARYSRDSIRVIIAGAARWTYSLKCAYRRIFPENTLWEIYGSTEFGAAVVMRPREHWAKPGSSGRAVPGVELLLRDESGHAFSEPYRRGTLYVRSERLFSEYEGAPDQTAASKWGTYGTSGDIAYLDEDGYVYITDREKDMIVSGGINVYPTEVEAVLDSHPQVYESAVIGVPDPVWGELVCAVVHPRPGANPTEQALIDFCRDSLSGSKVPRVVHFIGALPRASSGKVLKRELRERFAPVADDGSA
jgi:acyl-CoA synthetase (AMP-forming)/AMP-acid ligase II